MRAENQAGNEKLTRWGMISPSMILTVDMDFPSPFSVRAIEVDVPAPVGVVRQIQKLVVGLELLSIPPSAYETAAMTLYAARGRLIPFNSNSPTGSTFTAFSTFISTRGLIRICPGLASSQSREATLDTVPIAA